MEKFITFAIESLLLPPGGIFLLLLLGMLLLKRRQRIAQLLLASGLALFYTLSTPFISALLMRQLETAPALPAFGDMLADPKAAIVILSGGRYLKAPEYGGDTLSALTLERVRYGARLARRTHLPILVSGGTVWQEQAAEAALMKDTLEQDFNTPARWVEDRSSTTWENALYSKQILAQENIQRIYLVTHAWHMRRSVYAFQQAGFEIVPAPTSFTNNSEVDGGAFNWWPNAAALRRSYFFFHELVGLGWYRIKARLA